MFSVRLRCVRRRNDFCLSRQNRFSYILDIWQNVLDDVSMTLTQDHGCGIDHYKTGLLDCPCHDNYLITFWKSFVKNCYFGKFKKIGCAFFKVKHYFCYISGMVGLIDAKRKGSASVGYWILYVTLTFDLTYDLDLGCFKVKFRNSCISGIVHVIDVIWKGSEVIGYWANCMTLPLATLMTLTLGFQGQSLK